MGRTTGRNRHLFTTFHHHSPLTMAGPRRNKRGKPTPAKRGTLGTATNEVRPSVTTIHSPELLTQIFLQALRLTNGTCRPTIAGVSKTFQNVVENRVLIHRSMVAMHGSLFSAIQNLLTKSQDLRCKTGLIQILDALASFVRYPEDLDHIRGLDGLFESDKPHLERLYWTRALSPAEERDPGTSDELSSLTRTIWRLTVSSWHGQFSGFLMKYSGAVGAW